MSDAGSKGKTIQIFLPTGEPRGVRIAELTTRIVQTIQIPRSDLAQGRLRPELSQPAVYFLIADPDERAKPIVYIGQSESPRQRLDQHNANRDAWRVAIIAISRTSSFTQAHIRYLEWLCIDQASKAGRFVVENGNAGSKPFVPEAMEADILDAFETLSVLVSTLGFPLFDATRPAQAMDEFHLEGPNAKGTGLLVEDGFLVKKGAILRREIVPSAQESATPIRQRLIEAGVITDRNGQLTFSQDYIFGSPSSAAMTILGRSSNGWVEWKDKAGRTLHDVKRAVTAPTSEPRDQDA
jgi:hypothetical protein